MLILYSITPCLTTLNETHSRFQFKTVFYYEILCTLKAAPTKEHSMCVLHVKTSHHAHNETMSDRPITMNKSSSSFKFILFFINTCSTQICGEKKYLHHKDGNFPKSREIIFSTHTNKHSVLAFSSIAFHPGGSGNT